MVHHRQSLSFRLEPGHDLPGILPKLDNLQRDLAANRFLLIRHIHHSAAAVANFLKQSVTTDAVPGFLGQ